jgi:tyrosyl-tRNA synthetase
VLFGGATAESLKELDEATILAVFEGVPQFEVSKSDIEAGVPFVELCVEKASVFPSKGETRKLIQGGGVSMNKTKVTDPMQMVTSADLIAGKYVIVQKGKKNYFLIKFI